jgi:hypothetical protein
MNCSSNGSFSSGIYLERSTPVPAFIIRIRIYCEVSKYVHRLRAPVFYRVAVNIATYLYGSKLFFLSSVCSRFCCSLLSADSSLHYMLILSYWIAVEDFNAIGSSFKGSFTEYFLKIIFKDHLFFQSIPLTQSNLSLLSLNNLIASLILLFDNFLRSLHQ